MARVPSCLSAASLNKNPAIDFIEVVHQQNVGCDLKNLSPFHLSRLLLVLIKMHTDSGKKL